MRLVHPLKKEESDDKLNIVESKLSAQIKPESIRVAIVDDSVVVRGLISRWLRETPNINVVGTFRSGREIIENVIEINPDIIILDLEMPDIDGMSALPHILELKPGVIVIMASTLTARNADLSFKAMSLGAKDYLLKPQSNREVSTSDDFRLSLIEKIFALGGKALGVKPVLAKPVQTINSAPHSLLVAKEVAREAIRERVVLEKGEPVLRVQKISVATRVSFEIPPMRPFSHTPPKLLLIGASTGGPNAVMQLLKSIHISLHRYPVLIAQHMPAAFTTMFADHLTRQTQLDVVQATHGEPLKPGRVYIAPGGRHMRVGNAHGHAIIEICDDAPVNFCKPSVDVLFESCARLFGASCLSIILTGMGVDGAKGATAIAQSGGSVIAQDEETSIVWGMPGATVKAGACSAILSVPQMTQVLTRLLDGLRT